MASIVDYMFDLSHLEQMILYLGKNHAVNVLIIDSDGNRVPVGKTSTENSSSPEASKYYPFNFREDIGGLQCNAANGNILQEVEPHLLICLNGVNTILQREIEVQQTGDEMLQLSEQLNFLFQLTQKVIGLHKLKDFCTIVLGEISTSITADEAYLYGKSAWNEDIKIGWKIDRNRIASVEEDQHFCSINKDKTILFSLMDKTSCLVTPINTKGGPIGFMVFLKSREKRFFTSYEKKFVGIIEHIISPTIEALRLYDSLQELYLNTVKALAAAIDAKDEYTHGHSFRVAKYSVAIGRKMSIPENKLTDLEIAAYMHDLGKIGISETILGKPGKLTHDEYTTIKSHPVLTNKILEPIKLPEFIVDAAVQHHERLDGTGYPMGLKGDQISLYARIIMVADVFDALTSARPYREAMSVEKAMQIISEGVGKEFDQNMVLALIEALGDEDSETSITRIAPDLKFIDIKNFNLFLEDLIKLLLPEEADRLRSMHRINQEVAMELMHMQSKNLFELCQKDYNCDGEDKT